MVGWIGGGRGCVGGGVEVSLPSMYLLFIGGRDRGVRGKRGRGKGR